MKASRAVVSLALEELLPEDVLDEEDIEESSLESRNQQNSSLTGFCIVTILLGLLRPASPSGSISFSSASARSCKST